MKKLPFILIALPLLLTGCGGNNNPTSSISPSIDPSTSVKSQSQEQTRTISYDLSTTLVAADLTDHKEVITDAFTIDGETYLVSFETYKAFGDIGGIRLGSSKELGGMNLVFSKKISHIKVYSGVYQKPRQGVPYPDTNVQLKCNEFTSPVMTPDEEYKQSFEFDINPSTTLDISNVNVGSRAMLYGITLTFQI